jgi:hypothetical protein
MRNFDLTTPGGQQAFERYIVELIRNEINSYARQVLADRSATMNIADASTLSDADRISRLEQVVFRR